MASVAGVVGAFGLIAATEHPEAPAGAVVPPGAEPGNRVLAEFPIESLPGANEGPTVVRIVAADPGTTTPGTVRVRTRASS